MSDDKLRPITIHRDPGKVARILSEETERFRDDLKEKTGRVLTVGDTKAALQVFEGLVMGRQMPGDLSDDQRDLIKLWVDRLSK